MFKESRWSHSWSSSALMYMQFRAYLLALNMVLLWRCFKFANVFEEIIRLTVDCTYVSICDSNSAFLVLFEVRSVFAWLIQISVQITLFADNIHKNFYSLVNCSRKLCMSKRGRCIIKISMQKLHVCCNLIIF